MHRALRESVSPSTYIQDVTEATGYGPPDHNRTEDLCSKASWELLSPIITDENLSDVTQTRFYSRYI